MVLVCEGVDPTGNTVVDVYTVVGYSRAGYSPQEIADKLLSRLSLEQVRAALRCYAEYPDEIDQTLTESETEAVKAGLYRTLGPTGYRRLTGLPDPPRTVQEARIGYGEDGESADEHD